MRDGAGCPKKLDSGERTSWNEILFLAHKEFGYSLIEDSPNFIGKLTPSQFYSLFDGYSRYNKKQSDAMKGRGSRREINDLSQASKIPGVVIKKKPKNNLSR